jgi:hypothetical protein
MSKPRLQASSTHSVDSPRSLSQALVQARRHDGRAHDGGTGARQRRRLLGGRRRHAPLLDAAPRPGAAGAPTDNWPSTLLRPTRAACASLPQIRTLTNGSLAISRLASDYLDVAADGACGGTWRLAGPAVFRASGRWMVLGQKQTYW